MAEGRERDEREARRRETLILPAAFLEASALGVLNLGVVFYARDVFRASPAAIGWLAAMWSLWYVAGCFALRPVMARVPRRGLIGASTFAMAACAAGMLRAPSLGWLFLLNGISGFVLSGFWPPLMGWLSAGREGARLGSAISRFNVAWCTGNMVGPFLCGRLIEGSVRWPLAAAAALHAAAGAVAVAVRLAPRAGPGGGGEDGAPANGGAPKGADPPPGRETWLRYPSWVGLVCTFFALGILVSVFPLAAREELGFRESEIGSLLLVRALANAVGFAALGRWSFWQFRGHPLLAGQTLGLAAVAALAWARTGAAIGALLAVYGLAGALSYSNSVFHGASGSADRTARMAWHESLLAAGLVAGSVAGGAVYQAASLRALCGLGAAVLAAGLAAQAWLVREAARRDGRNAGGPAEGRGSR